MRLNGQSEVLHKLHTANHLSYEKMEELKNSIRVNNPRPGESVSVNYAEKVNGDGTVTLSASFYHCGLRVIVR